MHKLVLCDFSIAALVDVLSHHLRVDTRGRVIRVITTEHMCSYDQDVKDGDKLYSTVIIDRVIRVTLLVYIYIRLLVNYM